MRLLLSLLFAVLAATSALAQDHGEVRKYFKDWLGACRTDGYCSATAYQNTRPASGAVADHILRIGRHAEESYWEISFTPIVAMADPLAPFDIAVDGTVESFTGPEQIGAYGSVNDFFLIGPAAQRVMDRLAPGTELSVDFTSDQGAPAHAAFSLAGLTATLIWIDEQQRRLGSERVAETPPVGLDPVSPVAPATTEIAPTLLAQINTDTECWGDDVAAADIKRIALDDETTLFLAPCFSAAYNSAMKGWLQTSGADEFAPVALPVFSPTTGWSATTLLFGPSFDADAGVLSTLYLGRGVGDCGAAASYGWGETGGAAGKGFKLRQYRDKPDCDGIGTADDWPVTYPEPLLPAALVNLHNGNGDCSVTLGSDTADRVFHRTLDATHTLYVTPCEDFAYNFLDALYIETAGAFEPIRLLLPQDGELYRAHGIYSPKFDAQTGQLSSFYKGGNGNCGSTAIWHWSGEEFEPIEYREKTDCDASTTEWPIIHPSFASK